MVLTNLVILSLQLSTTKYTIKSRNLFKDHILKKKTETLMLR